MDTTTPWNTDSFTRRRCLASIASASLALHGSGMFRSLLAAESAGLLPERRIRSCIFVFLYGGPSHLDTWDMKPHASDAVRGEFRPVSTSVPGLTVSEHLPSLAQRMHQVALVRSMHHSNRLHDSASIETFTGRQGPDGDREEFAPIAQFFPCHGAALQALCPGDLPGVPHAVLPWLIHNVIDVPCQGGGFLGSQFDPFRISGESETSRYHAEALTLPVELSTQRVSLRRELLGAIETAAIARSSPPGQLLEELYARAYELLNSRELRAALDIEQESLVTRERYGMGSKIAPTGATAHASNAIGSNLRGQNFLLARRLVEAGVPFINVNDFRQQGQNWDTHADNFGQHRDFLLPPLDRGLSALIEDLDERGLLESTLVVVTGEFGRTPTINASAGRDHWPDCYSLMLAGGGIQGGQVYGSSDRIGAYPETDPVTPADLAATIFWRFGVDPRSELIDQTNRPHRLTEGSPLVSLF